MKWLALLVIAVLGCGSPPPAKHPGNGATASSNVKHPEMLAIMERYLMSPFADGDVLEKIRDFALRNDDVTIAIDEVAVPFLGEDLDEGVGNLLIIGFVAGNAASQLRSGVRGDDLIAGVEGELRIYLALKALSTTDLKDKKVISPSLDALLALQGKGELHAHLERAMVGRKAATLTPDGTGEPVPVAPRLSTARPAEAPADPEADEMTNLVVRGVEVVKAGRPQEGITDYFDKVIAHFQKQYAGDKRHIYCGHYQAETLLYLMQAANKGEEAIALKPAWAEAWFYKSYALTELHRNAEAVAALDKAIALSPSHAHYLSERGYLYHQSKDWQRSLAMYQAAEEAVKLVTDKQGQQIERGRALRGQGYALVELGDLDAAEKKYAESLATDPTDKMSRQEIDYIKGLRAKRP
jgi:tetratricopeptide (TPR) repeat protein